MADGFRPDLPATWPPGLASLVQSCWAADPAARPTAAEVARQLQALKEGGDVAAMDAAKVVPMADAVHHLIHAWCTVS